MRTTVNIPDELMKKAKVKAIEEGITFKDLVIKSLSNELKTSQTKENEMPWKALKGTVDTKDLEPGDKAFDENWEPESEFFFYVNERDKDTDSE